MKIKPLFNLLWALIVTIVTIGGASAETSGVLEHPDFDQIDRYIEAQMVDCRIPGFSLGIIKDGELLYMKGYGRADGSGRPVTPQTPFMIGSVSKTFTALAVMQLYEAGRIDLDLPVQTYLPSFALAEDREGRGITVHMLLNHTSGIPPLSEFQVSTLRGDDETIAELVDKFKTIRPKWQPGERFAYGNANYIILGALIEQVSGMPYGAYLQQNLFDPLEMRHSYTSASDAAVDGLALGYRPLLGIPFLSSMPYREDFLPAYCVISCAEDMTHFITAMQGGGRYKDKQVLSEDAFKQMTAASSEVTKWVSYGLGWYVTSRSIYHGGEQPDYQAKVKLLTDSGLGVALMYNTSSSTLSTLLNVGYRDRIESGIINILFGLDPTDQPEQSPFDLNSYPITLSYTILNAIMVIAVLLIALSAYRLRSFRKRLGMSKAVAWRITVSSALIHIVFPIALLIGIPAFAGASWAFVLEFIPDAGWFVLGYSVALLAIGLAKAFFLFGHVSPIIHPQKRGV